MQEGLKNEVYGLMFFYFALVWTNACFASSFTFTFFFYFVPCWYISPNDILESLTIYSSLVTDWPQGFYIHKSMHMDNQTSVYWGKCKLIYLQHTITSRYNSASAAEDIPAIGSFARGTNHHSSYYRTPLGPRWHICRLLSFGGNWLVLIGPAHYLIVIMYLRSSGDLRQPCITRYFPRFSSILI